MTQGSQAVIDVADRFDNLRVSEDAFARIVADRSSKRMTDPIITEIRLVNETDVDDSLILALLKQPINGPLDKDQLEIDIRKIYSIGAFSSVNFGLDRQGQNAVLELHTVENRVGNRFARFGI